MAFFSNTPRSVRMDKQGRIIIPADLRKALNVEPNSDLIVVVEGEQLILRPRQVTERDLWEMFGGVGASLSSELIQERRAEAEREG